MSDSPKPKLSVVPISQPVNDLVVGRIAAVLHHAEAGEVTGVAIVATMRNGDVLTALEGGNNAFALLGGLTYMQADLAKKIE